MPMSAGTPCLNLPNDRSEAETRLAIDMRERAAAICDALGDAEFALRAKNQNIGIATIAQRHYIACAAAIRALPLDTGAKL